MPEDRTSSVIQQMIDDLYPILDHAKFMQSFFRDVVEQYPEARKVAPELRGEYETMFNDEYGEFTYRLAALAVLLLERHHKT